jgi:hypothetical protein
MIKKKRQGDREYGGGPMNRVRWGARKPESIVLSGACPILVGARKETL